MPAQIRLPNPADDRPRAALVIASAVVGAVLGVAAVRLAVQSTGTGPQDEAHGDQGARRQIVPALARPGAPHAGSGSAASAAASQAKTAPEPSAANTAGTPPAPAAPTDAEAEAEGAAPGASAQLAAPAPEPDGADTGAGQVSRVTQVVPGRVAYVRCEGLSAHSGPYPCPRDRVLEAAVWDLLDTLHECRGAQPTADERGAELRLDFRGHAVVEASFRALAPEQRALEARLERCLLEPLRQIQTKLQPAHMVVSFRFQLL